MAGIFLPGSSKGASGDIEGVTAGDGLSGGGTDGTPSLALDLNELTAAAVADGDFIPIIDTNDSNGSRKEAVHDLATLFAGSGLTATNSVIAVDDSTASAKGAVIVAGGDGISVSYSSGTATVAADLGTNPGLEISSNKLQIAKGISQHDVAQFGAGVVDDDFLRVDGTTIEGLSAAEVAAAIEGSIDAVGTIASGTWEATDVAVSHGGTGASTLTANGVLIGNGTSAITSVAMATKGHILIGDGSGNPQMLGVGSNNEVLTADSGETTGVKWAAAGGGGIDNFDLWVFTANAADSVQAPLSGSWARYAGDDGTTEYFAVEGSGMSESSGVFTFPSTGKWLVKFWVTYYNPNNTQLDNYAEINISADNGSNYEAVAIGYNASETLSNAHHSSWAETIVDVTAITGGTTTSVRFDVDGAEYGNDIQGDATLNATGAMFIKLATTQEK